MEKKYPTRKQIHLDGFDYTGSDYTYFITICSYKKTKYFVKCDIAKIIIDDLLFRCNNINQINLYCYCLMPDHLHLLLSLNRSYSKSLKDWIANFKRYTSRKIHTKMKIQSGIWQRGFYEHIIRKHESLIQKAKYILGNPVRKGLSKDWESYKYSGFVKQLPM